jgi:alpha-D-xyloside xylohydrolase
MDHETGSRTNDRHSTIVFTWHDVQKTLIISDRKGTFPGSLNERTFDIVLVKKLHGVGVGMSPEPLRRVNYSGRRVTVPL